MTFFNLFIFFFSEGVFINVLPYALSFPTGFYSFSPALYLSAEGHRLFRIRSQTKQVYSSLSPLLLQQLDKIWVWMNLKCLEHCRRTGWFPALLLSLRRLLVQWTWELVKERKVDSGGYRSIRNNFCTPCTHMHLPLQPFLWEEGEVAVRSLRAKDLFCLFALSSSSIASSCCLSCSVQGAAFKYIDHFSYRTWILIL